MISQANISENTPMGANLAAGGGATFRTWAPLASAVYVNGPFGGSSLAGQTDNLLLLKDANGYWAGFVGTAQEGDPYTFLVVGPGGSGPKRDPYARELAPASAFPNCAGPRARPRSERLNAGGSRCMQRSQALIVSTGKTRLWGLTENRTAAKEVMTTYK